MTVDEYAPAAPSLRTADATTPPSGAPTAPARTSRWSSCCATWRPTASPLHRLGRRPRLHAPVRRRHLRHPARAGDRQLQRAALRQTRGRHRRLPRRARRLRRWPRQAGAHLEPHRAASAPRRRQLQRRHPDVALRRRARPGCVCSSSTTTPSASSTTPPVPRWPWNGPPTRAGPWSASRTTGGRLPRRDRPPSVTSGAAAPDRSLAAGYTGRGWSGPRRRPVRRRGGDPAGDGVRHVAELPVEVGLYTCMVPMAVYALLGGSRTMSVSTTRRSPSSPARPSSPPESPPDRRSGARPGHAHPAGRCDPARRPAAAARRLIDNISEATLTGVKFGVGLTVAAGQLPKLLGSRRSDGRQLLRRACEPCRQTRRHQLDDPGVLRRHDRRPARPRARRAAGARPAHRRGRRHPARRARRPSTSTASP